MREQGRESGNKTVFHLADLFHTTALKLGRAAEGKIADDELLRELRAKAAQGIERWVRAGLDAIESVEPSTP